MVNYLSLLGWSPGGDREFFGVDVLLAEFDLSAGQPQPGPLRHQEARGDQRRLDPVARRGGPRRAACTAQLEARRADRSTPTLLAPAVPLDPDPDEPAHRGAGPAALPLRSTRTSSRSRRPRPPRGSARARAPSCSRSLEALEPLDEWTAEPIEPLVWGVGEELGLQQAQDRRPGAGRRHRPAVSPPLFESMELLGRERTCRLRRSRLRRAELAAARVLVTGSQPHRRPVLVW